MSRNWQLYLDDMLSCCHKIQAYTLDFELSDFLAHPLVYDAVIRNLEVLGEAAKQIPPEIRLHYSQIEWRKISGLRDILAHYYFGLEDETLWDVIHQKVPQLAQLLKEIQDIEFNANT